MGSWKNDDARGRTYATGDLVELRDAAEKGFAILYRVEVVHNDGALHLLRQSGSEDGLTVEVCDVAENVFPARPEALATQQF